MREIYEYTPQARLVVRLDGTVMFASMWLSRAQL
jgi:hypothetical protein